MEKILTPKQLEDKIQMFTREKIESVSEAIIEQQEEPKNTPFFIFLLDLGFKITCFFVLTIGFRVVNIIIAGRENPHEESRKWLAMCRMTSLTVSLIISKPIGILSEIYGRRIMFLFCLTCWFLRLSAALAAFYFLNPPLMIVAAFLNGIAVACLWLPKVILKDILPEEKVSIWYTYTFVAAFVSQAIVSMGIGFLVDKKYGKVPLIYMAVAPVIISFICVSVTYLYMVESKPKRQLNEEDQKKYTWKDFLFVLDVKQILRWDNVGILFVVLFTTFWGHHMYEFDKDNFVMVHFQWSIFNLCILNTIAAAVTLILYPWGLTVGTFSDITIVKSSMFLKIIAYVTIGVSFLVSEYLAYVAAFFEAAGGIAEPILQSLLSTHGETSEKFGALHTLKSASDFTTVIFTYFYRKEMNKPSRNSIKPGLHFILAAIFIVIGTIIFWFYRPQNLEIKTDEEENSKSMDMEKISTNQLVVQEKKIKMPFE
jgi:MFS family permease